MKTVCSLLLLLTICFATSHAGAQNYQCLQTGVKSYYINGNGYFRGIRVDSATTSGADNIYHLFRTPRGAYDPDMPLMKTMVFDTASGSWVGKRVVQHADGTFIFDSYWNDSVVVKTQANVGDSWIFYSDTSSLYYQATVVSTDTMTIWSMLDSVKTIMINAYNASGIVHTDPVDSFTIILSKNNGFVQAFDLYTFPYHVPDSAYRIGLDFFLDRSLCDYNRVMTKPISGIDRKVGLFKLVSFVNPNQQQLRNWSKGDVIHSVNELGVPIYGIVTTTWLADTIVDKNVSGHFANYTVSGSTCLCPAPPYYPCQLILKAGGYSFADNVYPLFDNTKMPEEGFQDHYLFYFPGDTTFCSAMPAYTTIPFAYFPGGLGGYFECTTYKLGIGATLFHHFDGEPTYETDELIYYNISSIGCGTPAPNAVADVAAIAPQISVFPNPVRGELTVVSSEPINALTVSNVLGQTVYSSRYDDKKVVVDMSVLPAGVYLLRINGVAIKRFLKD